MKSKIFVEGQITGLTQQSVLSGGQTVMRPLSIESDESDEL